MAHPTIKIKFTPHHKTLTASGLSHFSRVSDALAEFIDNAIQATSSQCTQRKINLSIFLGNSKDSAYIVVADNGSGMNIKNLEHFATFSLDQETRGKGVLSSDYTAISKYGVGAKQAGFFLATRLRIITKAAEEPFIYDMYLDENDLERKYLNNEDVYSGDVYCRERGQLQLAYKDYDTASLRNLVETLSNVEANQETFTMVVLKLRPNIVKRLSRVGMVEELRRELTEIYYFHLHPEHSPDSLISERFSKPLSELPVPKQIFSGRDEAASPKALSTLEINLTMYSNSNLVMASTPLSSTICTIGCYIKNAKWAFRFNLAIPDPEPNDNRRDDMAEEHMLEGIILYFPYENGKETRPTSSTMEDRFSPAFTPGNIEESADAEDDDDFEESQPMPRREKPTSSQPRDVGKEDVPMEIDDLLTAGFDDDPMADLEVVDDGKHIFDIFWQNRLVPETKVGSLPFIPENIKSALECDNTKIATKWRYRIKGFLFFNNRFRHISNNKLKIRVDPNLETWMNDKRRYAQEIVTFPKSLDSLFKTWLQKCHLVLDQEYRFEDRDFSDDDATNAYFRRVVVGNNSHALNSGDVVRLTISRTGKGSTRGKCIFGRILQFQVPQSLDGNQTEYFGKGLVMYQREPVVIFGDTISPPVHLTAINFLSPCYRVSQQDLEKLGQYRPSKFKILAYTNKWTKHHDIWGSRRTHYYFVGQKFYRISLQILDKCGRTIIGKPQERAHRYKVRLMLNDHNLGETGDLWELDEDKGEETRSRAKRGKRADASEKQFLDCYYMFFGVTLQQVGEFSLTAEVLDDDRVVLSRSVEIQVRAAQSTIAKVEASVESSRIFRIGDPMPSLTIKFLDDKGAPVPVVSDAILLNITSNRGLQFVYGDSKDPDPTFQMDRSNNGVLVLEQSSWMFIPGAGFEPMTCTNTKLTVFEVCPSVCPGIKGLFSVAYISGQLATIVLGLENTEIFSAIPPTVFKLSNGNRLPRIWLAAMDAFDNYCDLHPHQNRKQWEVIATKGLVYSDKELVVPHVHPSCVGMFCSGGRGCLDCLVVNSPKCSEVVAVEEVFQLVECDVITNEFRILDITFPVLFEIPPTKTPCGVRILHNRVPLDNEITLKAGTRLSPLSMEVFSSDGEAISFSRQYLLPDSSEAELFINWDNNRDNIFESSSFKMVNHYDAALPDIEIHSNLSELEGAESRYEYFSSDTKRLVIVRTFHLELRLKGLESLTFTVKARLIPGEPLRWHTYSPHSDRDSLIIANDPKSLVSSLSYFKVVDMYKNPVYKSQLQNLYVPQPILEGRWDGFRRTVESEDESDWEKYQAFRVELSILEYDSEYVWELPQNFKCDMTGPFPRQLYVELYDEENFFVSEETNKQVDNGSAEELAFLVEGSETSARGSSQTHYISPWDTQVTLNIGFVDSQGNFIEYFHRPTRIKIISAKEKRTHIDKAFRGYPFAASFRLLSGAAKQEMINEGLSIIATLSPTKEDNNKREIKGFLKLIYNGKSIIRGIELAIHSDDQECSSDLSDDVTKCQARMREGGRVPSIFVHTVCEGSNRCELPSNAFKAQVKCCSGPKASWELIDEDFFELASEGNVLSDSPLEFRYCGSEPLKPGSYEICIQYNESRESYESMPEKFRTCSAKMKLMCVGKPVGIKVDTKLKASHVKQAVSNTSVGGKGGRLIAEEIRILAIDSVGNICPFPKSCRLACQLKPVLDESEDYSHLEMPRLEGSDEAGRLVAEMVREDDRHLAVFRCLQLEEGVGEGSRDIQLSFFCIHPSNERTRPVIVASPQSSGSPRNLRSEIFSEAMDEDTPLGSFGQATCQETFYFTSDKERIESLRRNEDDLQKINEWLEDIDGKLIKVREEISETDASIKRICDKNGLLAPYMKNTKSLTGDEVKRLIASTEEQRCDMEESADECRPPVYIDNDYKAHKIKLVVRLGYAYEIELARVLSWAARDYMDVVVCHDLAHFENSSRLWKKMRLDQLFAYRNEKGERDLESHPTELPLPPIVDIEGNRYTDGNPRYMVNLIQIMSGHDYLRDTLFYYIYGDSILFDDVDSARNYKDLYCRLRRVPDLYTLDGHFIPSNCVYSFSKGRIPEIEDLDFVYGQLPIRMSRDYQLVLQDLEVLADVREDAERMEHLVTRESGYLNSEFEEGLSIDSARKKSREISQKIKELRAAIKLDKSPKGEISNDRLYKKTTRKSNSLPLEAGLGEVQPLVKRLRRRDTEE